METFFKNIIKYIGIVSVAIVVLVNVLFVAVIDQSEFIHLNYYTVLKLVITLMIVVLFSIINKLIKRLKLSKKFKIMIFIGVLILYLCAQLAWIYIRHAVPIYDQSMVCLTADAFANNDLESTNGYRWYLATYPQQLTLAYVYSIIFKIFNTSNPRTLQILNALSNCLSIISLLLITKQLSKKYEVSKVTTLIVSLAFITMPLLSTFVYGDFQSLPFCLLAIYFIMKYSETEKVRYSVFSGLCIALACILRMNNLIFIIALAIYQFLEILRCKKENKSIRNIIIKIGVLVLFILIAFLPSALLKSHLQDKLGLDKRKTIPTISYLYMGMCEGPRSYGWYDNEIAKIGFEDKEYSIPKCKEGIKNRVEYFLKNPKYFVKFYVAKIVSMWAENTYGSIWYNQTYNFENNNWRKIESEKIANIQGKLDSILNDYNNDLEIYQKAIILIIFGMTLMTLLKYRKNISNEILLLVLCFIGGFMFHILWEAKSRYIIPYIVVIMPIVSINFDKINIKNVIKKENKEIEKDIISSTNVL